VARTPPPVGKSKGMLRAALVDSWYDDYRGVICLVQVRRRRRRPCPAAPPPPCQQRPLTADR
jgi:GTP-binding protein LepA